MCERERKCVRERERERESVRVCVRGRMCMSVIKNVYVCERESTMLIELKAMSSLFGETE